MPNESSCFIEPPHHHDLETTVLSASLPSDFVAVVEADLRDAVRAAVTVVSIMATSLERLHQAKLELCSLVNAGEASSAVFNAEMRFRIEQSYFDDEIRPDWVHKARLLTGLLNQAGDLSTTQQPKDKLILLAWWTDQMRLVDVWLGEFNEFKIWYDNQQQNTSTEFLGTRYGLSKPNADNGSGYRRGIEVQAE